MFALPRLSTASPAYQVTKARPIVPKFGAILAIDLGGRGSARFSVVPEADPLHERPYLYARTPVAETFFRKSTQKNPKSIQQNVLNQWAHQLIKLLPRIYDIWIQIANRAPVFQYDPNKDKIRAIAISFPGTVENGQITQARNMDRTYGFKWSELRSQDLQKDLSEALQKALPKQIQQCYWSPKLQTKKLPVFLYNDIVAALRGEIEYFFYGPAVITPYSLMEVKIGTGIGSAIFTPSVNLPQFNWIKNLPHGEIQKKQAKILQILQNTPDQIQTTSLGVAPAINPLAGKQETVEDYLSHNGFIKQAKRLGLVPEGMQDDDIPANVIDWAFNKQAPQHEKAKLIVENGIATLATALAFYASSRNANLEIRLGGGLVSGIEQAAFRYGYISEEELRNLNDGYFLKLLRQKLAERIVPNQPGHFVHLCKEFSFIWFNAQDHLNGVPNLLGAALLAENALAPNPKLQVMV